MIWHFIILLLIALFAVGMDIIDWKYALLIPVLIAGVPWLIDDLFDYELGQDLLLVYGLVLTILLIISILVNSGFIRDLWEDPIFYIKKLVWFTFIFLLALVIQNIETDIVVKGLVTTLALIFAYELGKGR